MKYSLLITYFILAIQCYGQAQNEYQYAEGFKYIEVIKNSITKIELPLIVAFHYSSSTPQEAVADYDNVKIPVRIIIPQGNFRKREGYSYFPSDFYEKDSVAQTNIAKETVDSLAVFLKEIVKKYKTKPIVAGFSQGGDISFLLAVYYPELIKASFPLAGFIHRQRFDDTKQHAQQSVPIYIFQGEEDKIVSINYSRREVSILSNYFKISLKTYPGLGHDYSPEMKRDYGALISKILRQ